MVRLIYTRGNVFDYIDLKKGVIAPPSPSTGYGRIYFDNDGSVYLKLSNGSFTPLGSGSGGGLHQATHNEGGGDELKLDDLGIPDDNTDLDASISRHGLVPKLPNDATKAYKGDGSFGFVAPFDATFVTLTTNSTLSNERALAVSSPLSLGDAGANNAVTLGLTASNLKLDDLGTPDDNTDLNATITAHGLLKKLDNSATHYMDGTGNWSTPAGTGGGGGSSSGGMGGNGGTATFSGNASTTVFNIPHGLGAIPTGVSAEPSSIDALGDYQVDKDITNIIVTYQSAPPSGSSNVVFEWVAIVGAVDNVAVAKGNAVKNGDSTTTVFNIPHGMASTPASAWVNMSSVDAIGAHRVDIDATNIIITYQIPPATGTGNLEYFWGALSPTGGVVGTGEVNTASNVGAGTGLIFKQKNTFDLELKSLLQGTDIALTNNTSDVTIAAGANVLNTTNTKTVTGKTILDSGTGNVLGVHVPYTFTIYQDASNFIIRNNSTGVLQTFANTDFAPALEWAINNIVNVGLGTQSSLYGGGIFIERGKYIAITTIDASITAATRHGIVIAGEGWGTEINFAPVGALTNGFLIDLANVTIKDLRITVNDQVTNVIHVIGHGPGQRRNDHTFLDNLQIEGPNVVGGWSSTLPPIANSVGILLDGTAIANYYSTIRNCKIHSFEKGIWFKGLQTTSCFCLNNALKWCETGIEISDDSGQLIIDGAWIQGDYFVGTTGIHVSSTAGGYIQIDHVTAEMRKTDNGHALPPTSDGTAVAAQSILIDAGVGNCFVGKSVSNAYDGIDVLYKTVVDNSWPAIANHTPANWNIRNKNFFHLDYDADLVTLNSARRMQFTSDKLYIKDTSGSSFNYIFQSSSLAASRTMILPVLLGPDTIAFNATAAIFTNKTYDAEGTGNTLSNVKDSNIKAAAAIATTKLADSANFLLKTLDNLLGAHYLGITRITAPPAAAAANSLNIYMDTATNHIRAKDSNDSVFHITGALNPVTGIKSGGYNAASATRGWGIFGSDFGQSTPNGVTTLDSTNGVCQLFATTGAVIGNGAHLRYGNQYTVRAWNPTLSIKFMLSHASANRVHMGFRSTVSAAIADGTDDPLSGISGIMLCQRAADTVWQIATNNATTTTFTPVAGNPTIAASTLYTIEFRADEANTKWQYSFQGGAWTDITATIPASSTFLGFYAGIQTNEAVAHNFRIYGIGTTSEK